MVLFDGINLANSRGNLPILGLPHGTDGSSGKNYELVQKSLQVYTIYTTVRSWVL